MTGLIGLAAGASASEYYSWIERSGTMVLTDDLSSLPPPTQRSTITVHRFADRPPATAHRLEATVPPEPVKASTVPSAQEEPKPAADPGAVTAADRDLPNIRLDTPEDGVKWQYAWVPLTMPVYHGGSSVKGFWAHHQTGSPFAAFHEFLQRTAPPIQNQVLLGRITAGQQRQTELPSEIRFKQALLALSERMISAQPSQTSRSPQAGGSRGGHVGAGR